MPDRISYLGKYNNTESINVFHKRAGHITEPARNFNLLNSISNKNTTTYQIN
jgi:hypothetical protein